MMSPAPLKFDKFVAFVVHEVLLPATVFAGPVEAGR